MTTTTSHFTLENEVSFPLPAAPTTISTYKHKDSSFRIVFCPTPGPLVSSAILVPTLAEKDNGLAHTLEHLIFCGSTLNDHKRGYLDSIATRGLSTGTNAYTTEDHTAYTITTAGAEGTLEVLPVFLEHVLFPTLSEEQFVTEVYHCDATGKNQGVVYCEMAGRENTEPDVLDLSMRRLLFQNETTYSRECGGLTHEVAKLTNEEIVEYHRRFYHLDNLTAIICGQIEPEKVFQKLTAVRGLLTPQSDRKASVVPVIDLPRLPGAPGDVISETVKFPSSDEELGSIAFGWRGPSSEDVFNIVALDVLFRYLQETAASPILQQFVEREDPYASQVDFDIRGFVETAIELVFSGVPYPSDAASDDAGSVQGSEGSADQSESGGSEEDSEDGSEGSEDGSAETRDDLFEPKVYHSMLMDILKDFATNGPKNKDAMQATLSRHRRKIMEALEEDPTECCVSYIIPDVVRHYLAARSELEDTRAQGGKPVFGTRAGILQVLDELATFPLSFWSDLVRKWLIDAPMVEVLMTPDRKLADTLSKRETEEHEARVKKIGPEGLLELGRKLEEAVLANKVNLTEDVIATMPPVPDVTKAASLRSSMEVVTMEPSADGSARPFETVQVVKTETMFAQLRIGIHTGNIPENLRPYLVLFQELLFQTPLAIPSREGKPTIVDYRDVARQAADLCVSYEASVGFGNDLWSASWLSEMFMMCASTERDEFSKLARFLFQVLAFSTFTEERIVSIAKNSLSAIVESKRDGSDMLPSIASRFTLPFDRPDEAPEGMKNDLAISLFRQEEFIKDVLEKCKAGKTKQIVVALEQIRTLLVDGGVSPVGPGFAQIAVSTGESVDLVRDVAGIWDEEVAKFRTLALTSKVTTTSKRRKTGSGSGSRKGTVTATVQKSLASPFPFPRRPYDLGLADMSFGNSVLVPIQGVTTTFLSQIVPCDIVNPHPHPDYFPVLLLAELLSRSEGPLYTSIRGQGYAYDASIHISLWTGMLSFELYESSEPRKAVSEFYAILESLGTPSGFHDICSRFNVETATASAAYKYASAKSTSAGLVVGALRGALRGFKSLEDEQTFQHGLYAVTDDDLRRAYEKYYL
ncbi:hypothetical protein HKX48_008446, partial [Thoreauomyces humboldtii]